MNNDSVYAKFLFIGLLSAILAACASAIKATPTVSLAEVVTVTVKRPFSPSSPVQMKISQIHEVL